MNPSDLELHPISPENHLAVRALVVQESQRRFVADVDKTLADAYVWKEALFRAGFIDAKPVGYVLVFPFDRGPDRLANIVRLMIDHRYQSRGLGRELLSRTLAWINTLSPRVSTVRISTLPDNEVALGLYRQMGFVEEGLEEQEIALYKTL